MLEYEFKATIDDYLASTPDAVKTRTLDELIAFNREHAEIELALFDQSIWEKAAPLGDLDTPAYALARKRIQAATRDGGIDAMLDAYDVDLLIAPSGPIAGRMQKWNRKKLWNYETIDLNTLQLLQP